MKRQFEEINTGMIQKMEVRQMSIQEMRLSNLEGKDVYSILPRVSIGEYAEDVSVYIDDAGNKAVVPPGWVVSMLDSENCVRTGLVIYRIPRDQISLKYFSNEMYVEEFVRNSYDQLVWVPMKYVNADGTQDGQNFTKKFGRRYSKECSFSEYEYHEAVDEVLSKQIESVKKYGGYYVSRYDISHSDMVPRSISKQDPWRLINFYQAKLVAGSFEITNSVKSHLMYGSEFDTMKAWIDLSDTNDWNKTIVESNSDISVTGKSMCINNIYDLDILTEEWTQEMYGSDEFRVLRGGLMCKQSNLDRMAIHARSCTVNTGFRIAICIN